MRFSIWRAVLAFGLFGLSCLSIAAEAIPRDVRYMLEDLYGSDQAKWPTPIYLQDVNHDGLPDWIAQQPGCKDKVNCLVDLFICKQGVAQSCVEYCYVGSGLLKELSSDPAKLKCQSTC